VSRERLERAQQQRANTNALVGRLDLCMCDHVRGIHAPATRSSTIRASRRPYQSDSACTRWACLQTTRSHNCTRMCVRACMFTHRLVGDMSSVRLIFSSKPHVERTYASRMLRSHSL
jgi:hypothetical protein